MLEYIFENTILFLEKMPKSVRKKKGQFFTSAETAKYMADMFDLDHLPESISILDPGSGTGILSAALVSKLQNNSSVKKVFLTCYETDSDVIPLLRSNLEYMKKHATLNLDFEIKEEDYLLSQSDTFPGTILAEPKPSQYDLVIAATFISETLVLNCACNYPDDLLRGGVDTETMDYQEIEF